MTATAGVVLLDDEALLAQLDPECVPGLLRLGSVDVTDDAVAIRREVHRIFDAIEAPPLPANVSVDVRPGEGDVPPLRVYRPAERRHAGAGLLWIHGGGLISGTAAYDDVACALLAADHGVPIVSVDYRLAPEWPYPHGLEDCFAAMTWALDSSDLGIDPGRLVVSGGSAGGGLAIALALLARDRGAEGIAAVVSAYPMLDDRASSPSMQRLTARRTWHREVNAVSWRAYLGDRVDVPIYAAPARADVEELRGLPPMHIDVGTLDGFLDEDVDFAARLAKADVAVELVVTPGASHGSEHLNVQAPTSRRILAARRAARERALAGA